MRNFILGVVITLAVLVLGGLAYMSMGMFPTNADATPGPLETRVANSAMDAAMEKRAPRVNSPLPATDDNLTDGMKLYTMNCAVCHGTLDMKPSALEHSMYPPPPQVIMAPLDDPEWHINYAIRTGVRYTGMPAWKGILSDQDIWKLTLFLARIEKLPPGVQDYWKKAFGVVPEPGRSVAGDKDKY
jgi:mono/diheme cytochrome c family protein